MKRRRVLITGAAGNLGGFLAHHLAGSAHDLRLMIHRHPPAPDLAASPRVEIVRADLGRPETLPPAVDGVDILVHFAGVLFRPTPERFLPETNLAYVERLARAAVQAGVRRFILISFPHVEGETTPAAPARGALDGSPVSVHAQTRLAAEHCLLDATRGTNTEAVILRSGLIYGRGVLMIDVGRWLMRRRLLGVWRRPTWIHPLALPDFLACVRAAIEVPRLSGVLLLGDCAPMTLQDFLDTLARHWGYPRPWRAPEAAFPLAGLASEWLAALAGTPSPLTRDFIRIGMVSHVCDTGRMRHELLPHLAYPTLREGLALL
jgi:nucleoside-diphosphate-sugar epimerase